MPSWQLLTCVSPAQSPPLELRGGCWVWDNLHMWEIINFLAECHLPQWFYRRKTNALLLGHVLLHFAVVDQQRRNKGLTLKPVTESEGALMCLRTLLLAILCANWGFQSCVKCNVCPNIICQLLPAAVVTLGFESGADLLDLFSCISYPRTEMAPVLCCIREMKIIFFQARKEMLRPGWHQAPFATGKGRVRTGARLYFFQ